MDLSLLQPEDFTSGTKQFRIVLNSSSVRKYLLRRKMKFTCQIHISTDVTRWKSSKSGWDVVPARKCRRKTSPVTEVKCQSSIPLLANLVKDSIDGVWNRRQ